ncbi:carbon monoxide dehydrogenase, partial [Chloroflexota bacterium]
DLIEERTGARPGQSAPFFSINPKVDDIPERYSASHNGIRLMVMGRIKRGGTGCYCPEGALLQALLGHLLIARNEVVILDMEAGIEHLARGTSKSVDALVIVVEPGRRSMETALTIQNLAGDLGVENLFVVGNKIRSSEDREFITSGLPGFSFIGFIPYDPAITVADHANKSLYEASPVVREEIRQIYDKLTAGKNAGLPA